METPSTGALEGVARRRNRRKVRMVRNLVRSDWALLGGKFESGFQGPVGKWGAGQFRSGD